jgi:hypothetical protein
MDAYKENVQNAENEQETSNSEKANEEEDAECIFCLETFC